MSPVACLAIDLESKWNQCVKLDVKFQIYIIAQDQGKSEVGQYGWITNNMWQQLYNIKVFYSVVIVTKCYHLVNQETASSKHCTGKS